MKLRELSIKGVYELESPVHGDDRGYFREWFKLADFEIQELNFYAKQANLSFSERNVVRGLHYSLAPEGQAKVVTCVHGELDDVIVDIRVGSPTYGNIEVVTLGANVGTSVYLPGGVAHGFCVTSDSASLTYLLSSPFNAALELEINPMDAELNIQWRLNGKPVLSDKDAAAPSLSARLHAGELPKY
jgi:dTDP-4-dehydrorhamnose 3,5-epimerase